MKLFTLTEANQLLLQVRPRLVRLRELYATIRARRDEARRAAEAAPLGGGGLALGGGYVASLMEFGETINYFDDLGIQIKDVERGLIDFPAWREDRVVLLCWHLGEGDTIEWWHDVEAGFAGRRPI